ncbi:MAG TPA: squalene--hopene cyclase [Polyangia bacterium]|nr:squalene--hopene cyclase [Polyangia bacterium]
MTTASDTSPAATPAPAGATPADRLVGLTPLAAAPSVILRSIAKARDWLLARQDAAGFWCGELEGDTTLESYMILLEAFFGRRGREKSRALARVLRAEMLPTGGWAQYLGGPPEISVSVLSYFAMKVAGEPADAPHMLRSRDVIHALGGAERANTYTKYHLALFGQYAWGDVPAIPPEMVFLPGGGPFTVYDMSSWSRTIFVPLSILYASKPVTPLPAACGVSELFARSEDADGARRGPAASSSGGAWKKVFLGVDRLLKAYERLPGSAALRRLAVQRAAAWMIERLESSDGLSAILPAMANSVMALKVLGRREDDPLLATQLAHLDALLLRDPATSDLRMQPCLSPVWDTVLATHALAQSGLPADALPLRQAASWLIGKQTTRAGDWSRRNTAPPGGWYFEYRNEFYPDVDDTCMALMVLRRARADVPEAAQEEAVRRGLTWMLGMQNTDGGWASFDRDNDKQWLTEVPFADHNAMIDPSTADITGRVLESLSHFPEYTPAHPVVRRALDFVRRDQTSEGAWYGRWGVNYIYGTWQVLRGVACIGEDLEAPYVRRGVRWLLEHQNGDGGWGESIASYDDPSQRGIGASTPSQTAWALMGLCAGGETDSPAIRRGTRWLLDRQDADGTWQQEPWTGTGFPKVFYLNYHYYRHYFPLMALAQLARARQIPLAPSA